MADQPSFRDRLARPVALATGMQLIAHNAPPTIGALREAGVAAERKWPTTHYACSLIMA